MKLARNTFGLRVPLVKFGERERQDVARGGFEEPGEVEDARGELPVDVISVATSAPVLPSPKKPSTAWVALPKSDSDIALTLESGIVARRAT